MSAEVGVGLAVRWLDLDGSMVSRERDGGRLYRGLVPIADGESVVEAVARFRSMTDDAVGWRRGWWRRELSELLAEVSR